MKITFVVIIGDARYERDLHLNYMRTNITKIFLTQKQMESQQYLEAAKLRRIK